MSMNNRLVIHCDQCYAVESTKTLISILILIRKFLLKFLKFSNNFRVAFRVKVKINLVIIRRMDESIALIYVED